MSYRHYTRFIISRLLVCLVVPVFSILLANLSVTSSIVCHADETETESGDGSSAADTPVAASDEGELAMKGFRKPAGWEVSLFAAEPDVANPVVMYVDNRGRVFVCESFRQDRGVTDNRKHDREWLLADLSAETVQDRIDYHLRLLGSEADEYTAHDDRIRVVEDTDGDHKADRSTVFADGFNKLEEGTGAGVLVRGNQAYYTCIPKLWLLTDQDGDGKAEDREVLHDGYGVRVAFRGHDSHGLIIGPDGRLYFSIGDRGYNILTAEGQLKNTESGAVFRCELDGSGLEVFATGLRNPQELAFDDYGYLFTGDNNSDSGDKARWVNVMQGGDSGWRMMYQYLPDRGPFNREKIWHPYSKETPAYTVPPIENIGDGPSGLTCYPGTGLVGDYANCFFMVDFRGGASNSGIRLIRAQPKGAFWEIERSEEFIWNILATDADFGPDGALWVCDWVNGWIGEAKGRIYRFLDPAGQKQDIVAEVQNLLASGFSQSTDLQLADLLRHLDRRIRLEAQWELAQRGKVKVFEKIASDTGAGTIARLHSVWGLGHAARLQPDLREAVGPGLAAALTSTDLDVRAAAAGVVGDLKLARFSDRIVELIADREPRVQYAACQAAGKLQIAAAVPAVLDLLVENNDRDPGLRHAAIMALRGDATPKQLAQLKSHASPSVRLAAVVALRKLQSLEIADFLRDENSAVQLEAARAVHDVPELHPALPQLAELAADTDRPLASDALAHRVLNAHFRLGGSSAAEAIAAFAANAKNSEAMRIEAIEMLGRWAEPGKLDRVMNRFQPIDTRDPAPAAEAFEQRMEQIFAGSDELISKAIETSVELKLQKTSDFLRSLAQDASRKPELRAAALTGFAKLDSQAAAGLVKQLVSAEAPVVRSQALALLADLDETAAVKALETAVTSDIPSERQQAWDTLANIDLPASTALISKGLNDYIEGKLPPDVWLNVIEAAEGRVDSEAIDRLNEFEQRVVAKDTLEAYRDCEFGGNVDNGRDLFFNKTELSCVRCHKVGETGGEVGPVLTEIAKTKDHRYLLQSIVEPDAKIAENFETAVLLNFDGQIFTGIVRKETDTLIELMDAEGKIIEIDPEDIDIRKKGKSAMPADLLKFLTRRELRDLVAYLGSLK